MSKHAVSADRSRSFGLQILVSITARADSVEYRYTLTIDSEVGTGSRCQLFKLDRTAGSNI